MPVRSLARNTGNLLENTISRPLTFPRRIEKNNNIVYVVVKSNARTFSGSRRVRSSGPSIRDIINRRVRTHYYLVSRPHIIYEIVMISSPALNAQLNTCFDDKHSNRNKYYNKRRATHAFERNEKKSNIIDTLYTT